MCAEHGRAAHRPASISTEQMAATRWPPMLCNRSSSPPLNLAGFARLPAVYSQWR